MKKILAKSVLVIIEAGLEVLAERIKKRRDKNGNLNGLDHLSDGRGAYDLRDRSAAHLHPLGARRAMKRKRTCRSAKTVLVEAFLSYLHPTRGGQD